MIKKESTALPILEAAPDTSVAGPDVLSPIAAGNTSPKSEVASHLAGPQRSAPDGPPGVARDGGGGGLQISNAEFVRAVFPSLPDGAFVAVCSKTGDPTDGGWPARPAEKVIEKIFPGANNYVCTASFRADGDGAIKARKDHFVACHFVMLDDIGSKVPAERLKGFELSWLIETSPDNFQGGIVFAEPITDGPVAIQLRTALIAAGLCDPGSTGALSRWARLPVGINGKPKHADDTGLPFQCRLVDWRPDCRYTPQEVIDAFQLELALAGEPKEPANAYADSPHGIVSRSTAAESTTPLLSGSLVMRRVASLLAPLEPDELGYIGWLHGGMAISHESHGSDEGLDIFDGWSKRGAKNPGRPAIEAKWRSFKSDPVNPITIATLVKMVKEKGLDWIEICAAVEPGFEPCEYTVVDASGQPDALPAATATGTPGALAPLAAIQRQFALLNLNGRLWVLEQGILTARTSKGTAEKLVLSNRGDATLFIIRAVNAQFPRAKAADTAKTFFESPATICYAGVEFNPAGSSGNLLNLWVGPTVTPKAGEWPLIRAFLLDVICSGDDMCFQYLLSFIAHALQRPWEKPGVLIVMLGGQGTGKGTLGRILHMIWSATYLQVHNIDAVTGSFNAALERAFIVFMDEALFVGDRRASDALKSLVTEPVIHVNEKHQPARQIHSYHRFFAATNADHMKNTDRDDRRDFALRVSEARKGDHAYWSLLNHEIDNGGVEAMVSDLQAMDLSGFNVRKKPDTAELLEQKLQSLGPVARWWHECLDSGAISPDGEWADFISTEAAIAGIVDVAGGKIYRKPTASDVVRELLKICPSATKGQRQDNLDRHRGLRLPSLGQARAEFARYIGGAVHWD